MTKKVVSFFQEKRVTPSVAAPGDTDPSDATAVHFVDLLLGYMANVHNPTLQTTRWLLRRHRHDVLSTITNYD